ncbi:hypothetical protein KORDIASMS9_02245 [Kordia sp. SMS9]|nr:hypothetical protein KORDIASMS9_02245 [Kordia sp. SMS9]
MSFFFSFSQEIKEEFKGEIHIVYKTVLYDEELFSSDAERYLAKSDSVVTIDYLKNPNSPQNKKYSSLEGHLSNNRLMNMILLRYNTGSDLKRPKYDRWVYTDSFIKMYKYLKKPYILDKQTNTYLNRYTKKPMSIDRVLAEYKFTNMLLNNIVVDTSDIKVIAGIKCFKVTFYGNSNFFDIIGESDKRVVSEMYVTDSIRSKYNPILNNIPFLDKFYPMYLKTYHTGIRGRYSERLIVKLSDYSDVSKKELEVSYAKLKDSLFAEYFTNIEIEKAKERAKYMPKIEKREPVPFKEQLEVLESLGYKLNPKASLKDMEKELIINGVIDTVEISMEDFFTTNPYSSLYYHMGWTKYDKETKTMIPYTGKCIWYDLEFIDPSSEYITLMKRMGDITDGELSFSNISMHTDKENYEWIHFKVNGVKKEWKLEKVHYIADSYFSRFALLTEEFKTKGRFTYYNSGSQQFVIDYATPEEQKKFVDKTGLQREWLIVGKHFSKPKD